MPPEELTLRDAAEVYGSSVEGLRRRATRPGGLIESGEARKDEKGRIYVQVPDEVLAQREARSRGLVQMRVELRARDREIVRMRGDLEHCRKLVETLRLALHALAEASERARG